MFDVRLTAEGQASFLALPLTMQRRVEAVLARLRYWPNVSGAKPMRKTLKGAYRIRSGDWRVLFTVDLERQRITVFRIANRRDVYED